MQLLFFILFGEVVSFILYLSYDKHVTDKKKTNNFEKLNINLNKYSVLTETKVNDKTESFEKVVEKPEENNQSIVRFKARRKSKNEEAVDEEII